MGQRANMVIVRHGDWRLYYDHWCANRLDVELFWGPDLAADFIEQRDPLENRNDWLDEVWCEGGAILDEDRRVLTWFGGEDIMSDVPLRRAFLDLMEFQWPNWEINWAMGGIVELGSYVNIPAKEFLDDSEPEAEFTVSTDYPEDNNTLLTVRQNKQTLVARIFGFDEELRMGPSVISKLQSFSLQPGLTWVDRMPAGGLHIDLDDRSMYYWRAEPSSAIEERVQSSWQGWRTKWLRDNFEEHLRLAGINIMLPYRDIVDLQRGILRSLRNSHSHIASNPARELAAEIEATDINPLTDETRSSAGNDLDKLKILDALESKLKSY